MIKKMLNTLLKNNDKNISNIILSYLNICDKCCEDSEEPLNFVISFGNGKRHYNFKNFPDVNLEIKKFCDTCCSSKASVASLFIEI